MAGQARTRLTALASKWDVIDSRDPMTFKHDFDIFPHDLVILHPRPESTVESVDAIEWQAYQGATKYQVSLNRQIGADDRGLFEQVWQGDTRTTRVDVATRLAPGTYLLQVTALGKYGSQIAESSITLYAK